MPRFLVNIRCAVVVACWAVCCAAVAFAAEPRTGEQIYKSLCASCHGPAGQGTPDNYPELLSGDKPVVERPAGPQLHAESGPELLSGDKPVVELARIIDKTMPDGEPEKCVGEDAQKVAAYIYDAFYSPIAQARIQPARIELSRLTGRQYQNVVTDLVGSFRSQQAWGNERGLEGEYYKTRRIGGRDRQLRRIDPMVNFDFGTESPDKDKIDPQEFSIRWEGLVLAPDSGEYEFIVRTEHSTKLWVNDLNTPLIDAYVKSGSDTEYRAPIRLLGGRAYPLKLEFSKANQGVNDADKQKGKPPKPASIVLAWKPPHRVDEVIPERCLTPQNGPELFVLQTPFPPDDRSVGYERGTSVSKAWDQATTDAAIETAGYIATRLSELAGVRDSSSDREKKLKDFCWQLVERAFRRPLTDEEKGLFIERQFAEAASLDLAVKRVVLLTLKSPQFLFCEAGAAPDDPYAAASRLSFALWDSLPDQQLLQAAADGKLRTRDAALAQAQRMLPDMRTRAKLRVFFAQWLKIEQFPDLAKDPAQFPDFGPAVVADLRTSLELFVEQVVWSDDSDFRRLISADAVPLNGRLAKLYGAPMPADAPFQSVPLDGDERAGVLTHPYLLASFAYTSASSPIHRGVFISRSLLGRTLKPPPEAVAPLTPDVHAELTTRQRTALQTKAESCAACHRMINPLGFTLEHFDAVGRFRSEEQGKPIDASGQYLTRGGQTVKFDGVRELAGFLAESGETHSAFVKQLFQNLIKQPIRAYGPALQGNLQASFRQHDFNIQRLAAEIAASSALPPPIKKP